MNDNSYEKVEEVWSLNQQVWHEFNRGEENQINTVVTRNQSGGVEVTQVNVQDGDGTGGNIVFANQSGKQLSKSALSKLMHRVSKKEVGKAIGSRIIRVLAVTEHAAAIQKSNELANSMLHSSKTQVGYIRKD
jgi:hypothetical protein